VETMTELWNAGITMWNSAPAELRAFALAVFTVSLMMEWAKRAFLMGYPKRERVQTLWVVSFPLGIMAASAGVFLTDGAISFIYWGVIGLTSGTAAMGLHYLTMKVAWPAVGAFAARFRRSR